MLPNQKASVDRNMVELTESLEMETPLLFSYFEAKGIISFQERDLMVRKSSFCTEELANIFHTLKAKDDGFEHLLSYLRSDGNSNLADKLQIDADGPTDEIPIKEVKRSALEEFSLQLARYYQRYYANVPTMGQSDKHVKDVWVPLQIDSRREDFLAADPIDHVELLNRLKLTEEADVALIKGDPGMGKTTLAKKIAYDWAVNYETSKSQQFRLVLAVPLRSVGRSNRFDQLAIDYFLSILDMEESDKAELSREIKQLKSQLLIILDGLDEYDNYSESLFKDIFARPFQHSSAYSKATPPIMTFKLIITSRPYACERVQMAYPLLRYVILPLNAENLDKFVQLYCETSHGACKVTEYLKTNAELVINVPLILTFICYLADSVEEIPTNMTSLYDSFIRQMLRRENRQNKLAESVDIQSWKDANVVKTTSELAYQGSVDSSRSNYEFSKSDLDKCRVTNDSFICGFLLHKFDFAKDLLSAEFPHRSIQEFFAALHCYQLMLDDRKDELSHVNNLLIPIMDSLVGRFFFGICSTERRFDQMIEWLKPSLFASEDELFRPAVALNAFGVMLIDCSSQQNFKFGQTLFDSARDMEDYIINFGFTYVIGVDHFLGSDQFSDDFIKSLNLKVLSGEDNRSTADWFLADNRKSARLVCVWNRPQELLEEKFDQIDFLILRYGSVDSSDFFYSVEPSRTQPPSERQILTQSQIHLIQQLPPVVTFVITADYDIPFTSNTAIVRYGCESCLKLTSFKFNCNNADRDEHLSLIAREKLADLTIDETTEDKSDDRWTIRIFKVTVNEDMSQSTLISSLIRLSVLRKRRLRYVAKH